MAKRKAGPPKKAGPVRVKWGIETGFSGASHEGEWEFDRDEWDRMTPEQRRKECEENIREEISNHIDGWYEMPTD